MRKLQPRSAGKEQEVIALFLEKRLSLRKIAELTGVPKSTVGNILRKFKMRNSYSEDFVATSSTNSQQRLQPNIGPDVSDETEDFNEDSSDECSVASVGALQFLDVHLRDPEPDLESLKPRNYDEHFLLSLAGSLTSLEEKEKNIVKAEILRVISDAHERSSTNNKTEKK